jgi:hypothetical protein
VPIVQALANNSHCRLKLLKEVERNTLGAEFHTGGKKGEGKLNQPMGNKP